MRTSVVLSTYNGENYIREQLDSLQSQSLVPDEVLIFDDGSNDQTVSIIKQYIDENQLTNWHLTVNKENKGWRRNFMEGMWNATGDIVFPCDQDDIWLPNKIEIMAKIMTSNSQIELLFSNYVEFFRDGKVVNGPWGDSQNVKCLPLKNNYMSVDAPGCVYCIRRSLLDKAKEYWRPEFGHDTLLWRMAELSQSLYVIQQPLIKWRQHRNSSYAKEALLLKTQVEKKKWLTASLLFNDLMFEYVKNYDITGVEHLLRRTNRWLTLRKKFYDTRNFIYGVKLIGYWSCYPRYRQLLGDWYLILFNR